MNEKIDLTKILKNCPKGTKLYSLVHGEVEFQKVNINVTYSIFVKLKNGLIENFTPNGKLFNHYNGECILFPSRKQRDWSKFTAPWYKKEKFDPKTLQPFDKVLILDTYDVWQIEIFSHIRGTDADLWYQCLDNYYSICIPYNDDTKHLVGTTDEAPEYYRYWED